MPSPSPPGALSPSRALEDRHQREMIRIHELWQQTKAELREKTRCLDELEKRGGGEGGLGQMHELTLELRDKLRFTELQLAASREEGAGLSSAMEEQRAMLGEMQARPLRASRRVAHARERSRAQRRSPASAGARRRAPCAVRAAGGPRARPSDYRAEGDR